MAFSERSQIVIVWWSVVFAVIYGVTLGILLHMIPPPDADQTADEVARWYQNKDTEIQIGAMIASWTAAWLLPLWAVITLQIWRQEEGRPIWTIMAGLGGAMASLFLVLPPIFWGTAAFTPDRSAETTQLMHQTGVLTFVTTDQFYIFCWVALIVICFRPQNASHSPFPRWYGYFNAWAAFMFEAGALAFNFKTGPFAWDGLLVLFVPLTILGIWLVVTVYLLLTKLRLQQQDAQRTTTAGHEAALA